MGEYQLFNLYFQQMQSHNLKHSFTLHKKIISKINNDELGV
jgi:hypothetical protein